jgi:predicted AAA+ superfamily ATPase
VEYLPRTIDQELSHVLATVPAVALDGAKGVGKTASASRVAGSVLSLDDPDQIELLRARPGLLLDSTRPVLVDEWQRHPSVWDRVRRAVDSGAADGSFVLTGSATPSAPTHSGAGRIARLRMRPLGFHERPVWTPSVSLAALAAGTKPPLDGSSPVTLDGYAEQIVLSGFPGINRRAVPDAALLLDGYVTQMAEHDFRELGHVVRRPEALRAWLVAYAAATASTASYEEITAAATPGLANKPARTATQVYRDVLKRLWLLDQLPPWQASGSALGALAQKPKHFLADPALAARLLGVSAGALTGGPQPGALPARRGTLIGALFEHLVVLTCQVLAQPLRLRLSHLRTTRGEHEVDLILEREDGRVVAVEVKLAPVPDSHDVAHLRWLQDKLGDRLVDALVVNTGTAAYRRPDGIGVTPLALLGP